MKKFISISQYPGKTGQHYYTKFFKKYNLDYTYQPTGSSNIESSLEQALKENVSGISISMPFKKEIIKYLDKKSDTVLEYDCCNTIVVENKKLIGYNTDWFGANYVLSQLPKNSNLYILGDGIIGSMFYKMLNDRAIVLSRKLNTWHLRNSINGIVINCTSFGTHSSDSPLDTVSSLDCVVDLAINSNQLEQQCAQSGIKYIKGIEFYKYQFQKQFEIYTGITINLEDF